jgi:hypothetical protein
MDVALTRTALGSDGIVDEVYIEFSPSDFSPSNVFLVKPDGTPFLTNTEGFIQVSAKAGEDIIPSTFKVVDCLRGQPGQQNTVKIQTWMHSTNTNLPPNFVEQTFRVRCIQ